MNQINILWNLSSIEASISEIFAIKNCCFLALIDRRAVGKIVGKYSLWRQCWSGEKKREIQTEFFESTWRRSGLCGHKPGKNRQFVFKSCIVKRTLTTFTNFLELYWKCACVSPIFFKMHSQNVFIWGSSWIYKVWSSTVDTKQNIFV